MENLETLTLLDDVLEFLSSTPTPEQIVAYQPALVVQQRMRALLNKNHSGGLSAEEQAEFDDFSRLNQFMSQLKARARKKLDAA
jgi:hypothetical protein